MPLTPQRWYPIELQPDRGGCLLDVELAVITKSSGDTLGKAGCASIDPSGADAKPCPWVRLLRHKAPRISLQQPTLSCCISLTPAFSGLGDLICREIQRIGISHYFVPAEVVTNRSAKFLHPLLIGTEEYNHVPILTRGRTTPLSCFSRESDPAGVCVVPFVDEFGMHDHEAHFVCVRHVSVVFWADVHSGEVRSRSCLSGEPLEDFCPDVLLMEPLSVVSGLAGDIRLQVVPIFAGTAVEIRCSIAESGER